MAYLLDTNVFVSACRDHYSFQVFPGFWECVVQAHLQGQVYSLQCIKKEIQSPNELLLWIKDLPQTFFRRDLPQSHHAAQQISDWVLSHTGYSDSQKDGFLKSADYLLVVQALAGNHVVVTMETPLQPHQKRKIKIPDVCSNFNVGCIKTLDLLTDLNAQFVLGE